MMTTEFIIALNLLTYKHISVAVIIENQSTHLDNPSIMTAVGDQQSK